MKELSIGGRLASVALLTCSLAFASPGVMAPSSQLTAAWWQWALSIPAGTNPVLDTDGTDCAEGQSGPVWFLAGTFGGAETRSCTIPAGKQLLLPILNVLDGAVAFDCAPTIPDVPCKVSTLRNLAGAQMKNPQLIEASIDGVSLTRPVAFRVKSPVFTVMVPSDGGLFGLSPGPYSPNVSDGYWLLIAPLSAGAHTIHVHGTANPDAPFGATDSEVTYNLSVDE
jgi:hypothetical protein